jgi:hypothetical protein
VNVWAIVGAVVASVTAAAVIGAWKKLTSKTPRAELQPLDAVVHNGEYVGESVPDPSDPEWEATRQTEASKARIEIRLKNVGERRSVVTSAIVTIRKLLAVPPCGIGAALVVSASYDIVLPQDLQEAQSHEVPINQELGRDEADRFELSIGREFSDEEVGLRFIYQLDVAVRHNGSDKPIEVARVLIELPGVNMDQAQRWQPPSGCDHDTLKTYREAAQLEGVHSPELEGVFAAARMA